MKRNPIIVALDVPNAAQALGLVKVLQPVVWGFKIGLQLFTAEGPNFVRRIKAKGANVFLDLKFHDIPNTVAKAVTEAVMLGVDMFNVHASGGKAMMEAAVKAARETARQPNQPTLLVLGVTVLTSLDQAALTQIGYGYSVSAQAERLARLAVEAGFGGLICSPLEAAIIRQNVPREIKLVTPGIRGPDDPQDDQKRTMSAKEAIQAGADWLVIGRPIYADKDPRAAAEKILATLN